MPSRPARLRSRSAQSESQSQLQSQLQSQPQPQPTPTALDRTLTYRLHQLHKITDQATQARYLPEVGLSLSDGRCLTTIGSFGPLSVSDLAGLAHLNKSQASRAAQALFDQGLVSKEGREGDARGVVLALTTAGRRVCSRAMALVQARNEEILGCLSQAEQAQLSALLDRVIAHNRAAG
ncbi:MAG: winged helix-turn-helix transcriptional regulator [Rubrivivax sp.]|nr:winged helix-turn-helix transcriptional regulator [Rubrivivax sp.]